MKDGMKGSLKKKQRLIRETEERAKEIIESFSIDKNTKTSLVK